MTPLRQRQPRLRDQKYLDWLKTQPCICTGLRGSDWEGVDPAHLGTAGRGMKSDDRDALPLIHHLHLMQSAIGEAAMWRTYLPDDVLMAALKAYARERYEEWKTEQS